MNKPPKGKKAQAPRQTSRFYWILAAVGVVGAALIAWTMLRREAATDFTEIPAGMIENSAELVEAARGVEAGPDDAPVRILVFSDYQCPGCKHFALNVEPQLHREFVDSGKVQLVYYDFPLTQIHQWAFLASRAGRCAEDQDKFWPYHDRLFATQTDWSFVTKAPVSRYLEYAREVGLDEAAFRTCLNSDRHSQLVAANVQLGTELGVGSTPTLFMAGRAVREEWSDYAELRERILAELARRR